MDTFKTITYQEADGIGTLTFNRPEIRNAFNAEMIAEITNCVKNTAQSNIAALVIRGNGKVFCAGADLNWMKESINYSEDKNYEDNLKLAQCFETIYHCPKPTIAVVHGAAMGGANGILSATDISVCTTDTKFAFSEVKIGIVPATIAPFIIRRIGEFAAKELMFTGRVINGIEAEKLGLVNHNFELEDELNNFLEKTIDHLKSNGPEAVQICKELIQQVTNNLPEKEILNYTARLIAQVRASAEGQEGMKAFLEKRKPNWKL